MNPPTATVAPHRTIMPAAVTPMGTESQAGRRALRIEIVFVKRETVAREGAHVVGPHLDLACALDQGSWWFLRRESGWHLHLDQVGAARTTRVLDTLVERGIVQHWTEEASCLPHSEPRRGSGPELEAGERGVSCAGIGPGTGLDLHRADSRGALAFLRQLDHLPKTRRPLLRTGHVLGILAREVCRSAGLDRATAAGVLDTLARRNTGGLADSSRARAHGLAEVLTLLWRVPAADALGGSITPWATDLATAARGLAAATHVRTDLPVGERATYLQDQVGRALAAQWYRLGLTATEQAILAVAIRDALRTPR